MVLDICVLPFVLDQDSVQYAREITVISYRVMHCGAVVPEGDRTGAPGEAHLNFRTAVFIQNLRQDCLALRDIQSDDMGLLREIHPKDFFTGFPMRFDNGVCDDRVVQTLAV